MCLEICSISPPYPPRAKHSTYTGVFYHTETWIIRMTSLMESHTGISLTELNHYVYVLNWKDGMKCNRGFKCLPLKCDSFTPPSACPGVGVSSKKSTWCGRGGARAPPPGAFLLGIAWYTKTLTGKSTYMSVQRGKKQVRKCHSWELN